MSGAFIYLFTYLVMGVESRNLPVIGKYSPALFVYQFISALFCEIGIL